MPAPTPRRARDRDPLATFLSMSRDSFLERHWTSQPLFVRGAPSRLPGVFGAPEAQSLEALLGARPAAVRTWFSDAEGAVQSAEISGDAAVKLHASRRLTVVLDGVRISGVDALMDRMKSDLVTLQNATGANAYVSPAGVGTRMHFDEQDVFLVQVVGRKRWTFAPQTQIKDPTEFHLGGEPRRENAIHQPRFPTRMPRTARSVVLVPGCVLYLPAGTWHQSMTLDDSIALTLTFASTCWLDLLLMRLRARLLREERWRERTVGILAPPSPLQARALSTFQELTRSLGRELSDIEAMDLLTDERPLATLTRRGRRVASRERR
jgi:ribosomal protein L16 Arg81 hydroxylase